MRPDLLPHQVRANLRRLVEASPRTTYAGLSRLLRRSHSYVATFAREGSPERLRDTEIGRLARFFGVETWELGGPGEVRGNWWPDHPQPKQRRAQQRYRDVFEQP